MLILDYISFKMTRAVVLTPFVFGYKLPWEPDKKAWILFPQMMQMHTVLYFVFHCGLLRFEIAVELAYSVL